MVYRILARTGRLQWPVPSRPGRISRTDQSHAREATDRTLGFCGRDGGVLGSVGLDRHDREGLGWEFAPRGRAQEAERALEEPGRTRWGTGRPPGPDTRRPERPRADRPGLALPCCGRADRRRQEFSTPSTPEQNAIVAREVPSDPALRRVQKRSARQRWWVSRPAARTRLESVPVS